MHILGCVNTVYFRFSRYRRPYFFSTCRSQISDPISQKHSNTYINKIDRVPQPSMRPCKANSHFAVSKRVSLPKWISTSRPRSSSVRSSGKRRSTSKRKTTSSSSSTHHIKQHFRINAHATHTTGEAASSGKYLARIDKIFTAIVSCALPIDKQLVHPHVHSHAAAARGGRISQHTEDHSTSHTLPQYP